MVGVNPLIVASLSVHIGGRFLVLLLLMWIGVLENWYCHLGARSQEPGAKRWRHDQKAKHTCRDIYKNTLLPVKKTQSHFTMQLCT
jgi:hypothetical protein